MLRFLTNKLRTQSLNEQQFDKAQDDHDSGTESDDESGEPGEHNSMDHEEECEWGGNGGGGLLTSCEEAGGSSSSDMMMMVGGGGGGRDSASSQFESCYIDSALPSDSDHAYDHHSSEEELEVINSSYKEVDDLHSDNLLGDDEVRGPGCENKRKWSQVAANRLSVESTSSSDDEVQGLLRPLSTPVEFCTSPPVDVHKPSRSQSPPPKLFLFSMAGSEESGGGGGGGNHNSGLSVTLTSGHSTLTNSNSSSSTTSNGVVVGHHHPPTAIPGGALINGGLSTSGVFRGIRRYDRHNLENNLLYNNQVIENGLAERQDGGGSGSGGSRSHHHLLLEASSAGGASIGRRSPRTNRESSRKRHRHHNPRHIQRPWLDFEKMQQLKARSVTTWRSGGELSLYCS